MKKAPTYLLTALLGAVLMVMPTSSAFADVPNSRKPDSLSEWVSQTTEKVRHATVYPDAARELAHEGSSELRITVDREGRVLNVWLAETSGHDDLDCAADTLVQSLVFPALPEGYTKSNLTFNVAITYDLMSVGD